MYSGHMRTLTRTYDLYKPAGGLRRPLCGIHRIAFEYMPKFLLIVMNHSCAYLLVVRVQTDITTKFVVEIVTAIRCTNA